MIAATRKDRLSILAACGNQKLFFSALFRLRCRHQLRERMREFGVTELALQERNDVPPTDLQFSSAGQHLVPRTPPSASSRGPVRLEVCAHLLREPLWAPRRMAVDSALRRTQSGDHCPSAYTGFPLRIRLPAPTHGVTVRRTNGSGDSPKQTTNGCAPPGPRTDFRCSEVYVRTGLSIIQSAFPPFHPGRMTFWPGEGVRTGVTQLARHERMH